MLRSAISEDWLKDMAMVACTTPKGCFVEVGVWQGGSAQYLYGIAHNQKRELHLFDTFTGIPNKSSMDRHNVGDFSDTNIDDIKRHMPNAILHVGIFPETLTDDLKDIAFIHADVDQYISQKDINKYLWPRVVPGGIMMLDDYFLLEGINQAINEDFPDQVLCVPDRRPLIVKDR